MAIKPRSAQAKGKQAERDVVALFRANGWPRAARSPGSGSMRPYGPGDLSPWPGDLAFTRPWLVEVKHNNQVATGKGKTWPGSSFIKATARDLAKLRQRHTGAGQLRQHAVIFARSDRMPWRVFVPEYVFGVAISRPVMELGEWVEIDPDFFFTRITPLFHGGDYEPAE